MWSAEQPHVPEPGTGGAPANPGYQNQGVGGAPPANPGYQIQGVGGVPPANPGYQNQAVGGAPPLNPGYQNQVLGGAPPVDPGYISEWEELPQIEVQQQDPSDMGGDIPKWSNLPKETILDDGCDFEHWLVVMESPDENATRDDIIDSYIKTLAQVVGSEDEARKKIYSVSSRCYFAFGCLVSEELSYKIKELPKVGWVVPDAYWDMKNKVYAGEPFIDGKAVPYDPKYHAGWIGNNAHPNEISRQNDRPRNFDRSRNFERRRDNMQKWDINTASSHPVVNNAQTSPNPGTGSTGTAPYLNQGSVPAGGMPNPGFQSQGQGGMPSGGYRNQNRVAMPNSGFQNQGYQSPGMGGVQNNPTYPDQGPGGAPANPGYQNQGVGGAPPANPGYEIQGVGGVSPANPGYQIEGVGGVPPANPGYQNQAVRGAPTIKVECQNEAVRGAPTIKVEREWKWQVYDEFHKQFRDIKIRDWDTVDDSEETVVYQLVFNVVPA